MIRKTIVHIGFVCSIIVSSCKSTQQTVSVVSENTAQPSNSIDNIDSDKPKWYVEKNSQYHSEKKRYFKIHHTLLDLRFDWQKQYLHGIATLTLSPYQYPQHRVVLDAKGFDIHAIQLVGKTPNQKLDFLYDSLRLQVILDKNYTKQDTFKLSIQYTAKPNDLPKGGSTAITDDRGLYFINPQGKEKNKPRQIWTQGETQASSCWFPTFDAPNVKTSQEMYITVDASMITLSNGKLLERRQNNDGTRTDHWKQEKPHAPYLFMMAVGNFSIVKDQWKGLPVHYYVEPAYAKYARSIFGNTPEMMSFFSDLLQYPYPWDKYHQVVVRDYVSGAMENTSASVFMEELQTDDRTLLDGNWDAIIAHELFHQWFGDLVTCESWSNLTLNEGFATYSEYLWDEYKHGKDVAEVKRQEELQSYLNESTGKQVDLIRYHYKHREDMFDNHSYAKGSLILHLLRSYVGDDAFFQALHIYLKANVFKAVEINHLRLAFEEVTGEDLNWFFNQWFLSSGHPQLYVKNEYENGHLLIRVLQQQDPEYTPIYRLPVAVAYWVQGKKYERQILITQKEEVFEFLVPSKPELVLFDPENIIPGLVDELKTTAGFIAQFRYADNVLKKLESLEQLGEALEQKEVLELYVAALQAPQQHIRSLAVNTFEQHSIKSFTTEIQNKIILTLTKITTDDPEPEVRADALQALVKLKVNNSDLVQKALKDSSYLVVSAAIYAYIHQGGSQPDELIERFEAIDNANIISIIADYYSYKNTPGKFTWFAQKIGNAQRSTLPTLLSHIGNYLLQQSSIEQLKGIELLKSYASNSSPNIRLSAFYSMFLLSNNQGVMETLRQLMGRETNAQLKIMYKQILEKK